MRKLSLLALCVVLPILTARAEDPRDNWAHWRGPDANGVAPTADPPLKWDDKTNIKWKAPLDGQGSATPIVWGDRVFVVAARDTGRKADPSQLPKPDPRFETKTNPPTNLFAFTVTCLDRKTGKPRWARTIEDVPHEGHHPTHTYAAGSPTTDGQFLYVSFGSFGIYCYDFDGNQKWKRDLGRMHTRLGWGEAVTPVIHGDNLLLNWDQEVDSALYCLDPKTGATKWKTPRDEHTSWNTPLVVEHKGRTQVIVNGTERIRSYDLADGKEIWQCGGMTVNAIPSAVAANGVVYVMSGYKGSKALAISLDSKGDVTKTANVLWSFDRATPYVPSPLLLGDRLYFTQENSAILTSLDIKTGKPLIDRERLPGTTGFYASPMAAKDRLYFVGRDGTTLVLKQGDKLEILATNKLDDTIDASPVAAGKQLFLRGEKYLYCIEME